MAIDLLRGTAVGGLLARDEASGRFELLGALALGGSVAGVAAEHGGYFPTSWGWITLALLALAAAVLLVRTEIRLARSELAFLCAVLAFVVWIGLSILWSASPAHSVDELERSFVYLAGALALQLVVSRSSVTQLLAGLLAGLALLSGYALAGRLFPDRLGSSDPFAVYRLSEPVGYWNALGVLSAMGALLALGFAARGRPAARAAAAATLPVLVSTAYFTFGRGGWAALAVGLVGAVALDPRRLQLIGTLLAVTPAAGVAVWLASRSEALTTRHSSVAAAARDGHRLALAVAALALVNGLVGFAIAATASRLHLGRASRRAFAVAVAVVVLSGLVGAVASLGGPPRLVERAYRSFAAPPNRSPHLSRRLLDLSSNGRIDLWRVAWREFEQHPWLGGGAGSYEQYWHLHRPSRLDVRDAHSLYLETLAELGAVGLALLTLALALPVLGAVGGRHEPLVPFALGAYAAFLLHAGVDWDWEMPAAALAGLCCGGALLASIRESDAVPLRGPRRFALAGGLLVPAALAGIALLGNGAAASSAAAAASGNWPKAEREARDAERWAPWSPRPWRLLADAKFGEGDFAAAARYYRKAIAKDPRDSSLWFDLGFAGEGRAAAEAFARAAQLDPRSPDIARAQAVFGRVHQAKAELRRSGPGPTNPRTGVGHRSPRGDGSRHPGKVARASDTG